MNSDNDQNATRNTHLANVTAAVLAGGKSSRFGEPKAFVQFNNRSLLDISLAVAAAVSAKQMVITREEANPEVAGVPVYGDLYRDCGPLGGIYTALYHCRTDWVAVIPCDMPLLSPLVYHFLYTFTVPNKPLVALSESGVEPLVSFWPRSSLPVIHSKLLNGKYNVGACLDQLKGVSVDLPSSMPEYHPVFFTNVNYKCDLSAIELCGDTFLKQTVR